MTQEAWVQEQSPLPAITMKMKVFPVALHSFPSPRFNHVEVFVAVILKPSLRLCLHGFIVRSREAPRYETLHLSLHWSLSDFCTVGKLFLSSARCHSILPCCLWSVHQVRSEQHCPAHSGLPKEVCHPRLPGFHLTYRWSVWEFQNSLWRTGVSANPWFILIILLFLTVPD